MKIALDIMGGDFAPAEPINGAVEARDLLSKDDEIILVGNKEVISDHLKRKDIDTGLFTIVHAGEVIGMNEQPTSALSKKRDSSINIGFQLLKNKAVDAFISAGNTGAMLVASIYSVNAIPGIIRPCIPAVIPKSNGGYNIILDVGSNPDCKPDVLHQFAIIGSIYAEKVMNINAPKVGLLNIGEEESKGNLLTQATFQILKDTHELNFIGNVEPGKFFKDYADVIVADGFLGNIVLKEIEAFYEIMVEQGVDPVFLERFNYENYGGTPILGINSIAIIGHGISSAKAFKNMFYEAKKIYNAGFNDHLRKVFHRYVDKLD